MKSTSIEKKAIYMHSLSFYDDPELHLSENTKNFDFYNYPDDLITLNVQFRLDLMHFCPYCGKKFEGVTQISRYCPYCGYKLREKN